MAMARKVITSNLSKLSKQHQRNAKRLPLAVAKGFTEIAAESVKLYQKTTRTWDHKPAFYAKRVTRGITINTDSQIYQWVDRGTRPHTIEAKNAPFLVFRWPYKAKTKVRVIASYQAHYGSNLARKFRVHHPGTAPRHFTDEITRRMQKRAAGIMRRQIKEAVNTES